MLNWLGWYGRCGGEVVPEDGMRRQNENARMPVEVDFIIRTTEF
jgi:hypothetical protein